MDIIAPILSIVSFFCTCSGNTTCYLCDLQENKDALDTAMEELKAIRADVKRRVDEAENNPNELMKRTHEVNSWIQRVEAIEGEVVQVIQKADQEIQGKCIGGYCPKNCWSVNKIGKLVIRKLAIVNDLRSKGNFGNVACELPPRLVQKQPVDLTVGMESMFDKVLKSLAEDEVRIIGLYGQGGVGKTTLLKQINNEFLESTRQQIHGFDVVILVVVSKEINIDAIQKEIGRRLGLSSPDKTSIFNALSNKSFLMLLDDIWERVDLQSIGVPRPENNKSKILFTTRSEDVCGKMDANKRFRVECLPWDAAWTLFKEKVGNEFLNSPSEVAELAKVVAKECGGLPLALITIGRAMSNKTSVERWKHAITTLRKSASDFQGMSDEILTRLKLSYDNLRNDTIKSCFLYCAFYPEDYSIQISKLIDYWIGEGFILLNEFDHIDEARNHGYDIIGILKDACLLESGIYEKVQVKMHDTIRDLALWIASEFGTKRNKMLIIGVSDDMSERWSNAERIYLRTSVIDERATAAAPPPESPNLLTLIYEPGIQIFPTSIPNYFFQFMPLLRVLDLSYSKMETFPISITELLELRYLSLSKADIKVLPEELRKLVKLNYLDLTYMYGLMTIPNGVIGSLLELRVLSLYHCPARWDVEELYNLKHLNDLKITVNTQPNLEKLLTNKNLQMSTRHLHLGECNKLPFSSSSSLPSLEVDSTIKSLEKLELLLSNLETLIIQSLPIDIEWGNHHKSKQWLLCFFQKLGKIEIICCNALKDLTWVVYVENLKRLVVDSCEEIEEIIVGDKISKMMNTDIFKSLKSLTITYLPKLKSICSSSSSNALVFPSLVYMYVERCPELKKLPFDSGSNVNNTLQKIRGEQKWWNELQWKKEEDHDNVKSKFVPHTEYPRFND